MRAHTRRRSIPFLLVKFLYNDPLHVAEQVNDLSFPKFLLWMYVVCNVRGFFRCLRCTLERKCVK